MIFNESEVQDIINSAASIKKNQERSNYEETKKKAITIVLEIMRRMDFLKEEKERIAKILKEKNVNQVKEHEIQVAFIDDIDKSLIELETVKNSFVETGDYEFLIASSHHIT